MHKSHSSPISRREVVYSNNIRSRRHKCLVLLHTEMPNLSVASFRFQPLLGEAVATYGFPYSHLLSPNFTSGDIAALSGPRGDTRLLQTSTPIQPGNSGG